MTEEQKKKAAAAALEGVRAGYEKTQGKGLRWWERAIWLLVVGGAYAVASLLQSCTVSMTRLPDGTVSFNGAVVQPVTVQKGK